MSSHFPATSILSIELAQNRVDGYGTAPDWQDLSPPEQATIQLWLEQALTHLRQTLDAAYLRDLAVVDTAATDRPTRILQTFLEQVCQNLDNTDFSIVCANPEQPDQYISPDWMGTDREIALSSSKLHDRQSPPHPTAWPLTNQAGTPPIAWLILEINAATGWVQTVQQMFLQRAIVQLADVLRIAEVWQQTQIELRALRQKNQELTQVSQLKSEFLANTSHEIRTPLSSILGFTHLLREQGFTPDNRRHQEYLRIILTSGQHLLALINDILDLSKIEANQMDLQWANTELAPLCQTIMALVQEKANDKQLRLKLDRDATCKQIAADPLRLKQMLFNLLSNAIKFTQQGSIGLRIQPDGQYMRFIVWDTGPGIPPEQRALLFRAYSQLPQDDANRSIGTGLGLALTQKLAALHGGWIEVESSVGQGSMFTIVLPLAPATAMVPPANQLPTEILPVPVNPNAQDLPEAPKSPLANRQGQLYQADRHYHLLLVEDNQHNARLIITYVCRLGYEVTWVQNSQAMWKSLAQSMPAMILMDINLPDVDGLTLTRQLRQDKRYQNLPIIAQTAMAMVGDRETCLAAGVNEYLPKPIDLKHLADVIHKYAGNRDG
jgi:hypothetical protein